MNETIQHKLQLLPDSPGCYLHKNKAGTILYVGKAKNLKNRVRSYFRGAHDTKTEALVAEIADFDYIVTDSPIEALLLEINLIKENKPRYNILLKDDKSYPFIRITRERHPRLLITRQIKKDGSHYFGPYPDVGAANQTLKLLDRLYPFRKCKLPEHQFCLYYHLGQCLAHGEQLPSLSDYDQMTREVAQFLTGKDDQIVKDLQVKMQEAVSQLAFEKAAECRDLLEAISTLRTKQRVMAHDLQDRDVFGYYVERGWMCVQVFFVRQGKLIERAVQSFPYYNDAEEDFLTFLGQFYSCPQHLLPAEILIPKAIDKKAVEALVATKVRQPQRGEKKQLVQLAIKNARVSLEQQFSLKEKSQAKTHGAIVNLGRALGIPTPFRIEAFDNSNTMGTNPVSAMVVFEGGKPNKKEYRKYKIKTVTGPDDYATMREVLRRRYGRMLREGQPQPDLIVIDGGAGQVGVAREVLYEELGLSIPLAGLQKNARHQTQDLLYGDPLRLVPLSRQSEEFFLLHRIQEEVHRFAVSFHRQVRSKTSFSSRLDGIPGLGPKRKQALLKQFKTLSSIQKAEIEDLTAAGLPFSVAQAVQDHLGRD